VTLLFRERLMPLGSSFQLVTIMKLRWRHTADGRRVATETS